MPAARESFYVWNNLRGPDSVSDGVDGDVVDADYRSSDPWCSHLDLGANRFGSWPPRCRLDSIYCPCGGLTGTVRKAALPAWMWV